MSDHLLMIIIAAPSLVTKLVALQPVSLSLHVYVQVST